MSFDTSWDVDKYKDNYESNKIWEWKRAFMLLNKNKFQENCLVNLADMFTNLLFLKWKYPEMITNLLRVLSVDLEIDWRDDVWDVKSHKIVTPYTTDYILPGFILALGITEDPLEILDRSCTFCNMTTPIIHFYKSFTKYKYKVNADLFIGNILVASSFGTSRPNARYNVVKDAYYKLKRFCFAIKIKEDKIPIKKINVNVKVNVYRKDDSGLIQNSTVLISTTDALAIFHNENCETELNNDNIGKKLVKMMGWQDGTGLGRASQGRLNPIDVNNIEQIQNVIKNYISQQIEDFMTGPERVISYATQCTTNERRLIHLICQEFGLITRSYGDYPNRCVMVFKKENSLELFNKLIYNGFEDDYYELICPEKFK